MRFTAAPIALFLLLGCGDDSGTGGSGAASQGGGGAGAGGDPATGGAGPDLADLTDTFDAASLDPSWTVFNPDVVDVGIVDGSLALTLTSPALWYQASQGTLVYKSVTGDFKVTANVHARKTSAPADPPDIPIHLGGLMARDPASDDVGENYVFIVVGYDEDDISVETKTTTNDASTYEGPTWPSTDAELRLCRVGADFHLYKRDVGGSDWEEAQVYSRPDLPDTLQVGPNAYSLMQPDLTVTFDEVTFGAVASVDDCTL